MRLRVIIAEKDSVARKIACSICKMPCEDRRSCGNEHEDIFLHFSRNGDYYDGSHSFVPITCVTRERRKRSFYYQCNENSCRRSVCRHYPCHLDMQGKSHSSQIKRRIRDLNEERSEVEFGFESVKYYEIQQTDWKTIILSTNGTMLSTSIQKTRRESILEKIIGTPNWEKMGQYLRYFPKEGLEVDRGGIRSYFFTNLLFKAILVRECRGKIDQVIFATDYDIAGSFIALSILEKTQADRRKIEKEEIDESQVKRMILKTLTEDEILSELDVLKPFDWGNAYGGKLRSTLDFFFGKSLSQILRKALEGYISREKSSKLAIGRVQLPALFLVINRDWETALNKDVHSIYFLIKGYFTKRDIMNSLKEKDFVVFLTRERKTHYSESQFLIDLAERKIGTHTTRLRLPRKLERSGLIEFDNNRRICSTRLGLQYYNVLRSRLRTRQVDFASIEFGKRFYGDIEILKTLDQDSEEMSQFRSKCEQKYNELMEFYYNNVVELIPRFQNDAEKVAPLLACAIDEVDKKKTEVDVNKQEDKNLEYPLVLDAEDCIPPEYLDMLVDSYGRYREPENDDILLFYRRFLRIDLLQMLRLLLRIPRDTDFTICSIHQKECVEKFNEDNCIVYKATIPDDVTSNCMERFNQVIANLRLLQLKTPVTKLKVKKKVEVAHEPLHTVNLQHRNVPGRDGKKLVREYDRPYIYTVRKLMALSNEKGGLIDGFSVGNLEFQPIDPYEPFEAHNYESMLFIMYEKYQWKFSHTSEMMQKLYEGGESY